MTENKSIKWLEIHSQADPTAFALKHEHYFRGLYDIARHIGESFLSPDEIYMNGREGRYVLVGVEKEAAVKAISDEEVAKKLEKSRYSDETKKFIKDIYSHKNLNRIPLSMRSMFTDPDKVIYLNTSKELKEKLFGKTKKTLMDIAVLAYPEKDRISMNIKNKEKQPIQEKVSMPMENYNLEAIKKNIQGLKNKLLPSKSELAMELGNQGIYAKRKNQFKAAILYYQEIIKMFPEIGGIYYNLGKLFYIIGEFERAQKAYTLAYIYGANHSDYDLFRHLGHAVHDTEMDSNTDYIKDYRESISGHYSQGLFCSYDDTYAKIGRSAVKNYKKRYEEMMIYGSDN